MYQQKIKIYIMTQYLFLYKNYIIKNKIVRYDTINELTTMLYYILQIVVIILV